MSKVLSVLFHTLRIIIGVVLIVGGALCVLLPIVVPIIDIFVHTPGPNTSVLGAMIGMACGVIVTILGLRCLRIIDELPF